MALSDDEIDLLRHSLRLMNANKALAADIFYDRLFELAPHTRPLFGENIIEQTEKVMISLGAIVGQIHNLDLCRDMTRELALRHLDYGVKADHYPLVGESVFITLAEVLREDFTPEMEIAWRKAYADISASMIEAAYAPAS